VGETSAAAAAPVPERVTVWGLSVALSATLTVAVRIPPAVGLKVTLMVQWAPTATLAPQLWVRAKLVELAPDTVMPVTFKVALPVLARVIACAALVVPTAWLAKVRVEGEALALVVAIVPETATVCGLPVSLSVMVTSAVRVPAAVGLKVIVMEQLAPAATFDPQLLLWVKSLAFVPDSAILVILKVRFPELASVIACAALAVPTAWLAKVRLEGETPATAAVPVPDIATI